MKFKLMTALFAFLALTLVGCGGANSAGPTDIGGGANGGTTPQTSPTPSPTNVAVDAVTGVSVPNAVISVDGRNIDITADGYAYHRFVMNSTNVYKLVRNDSEFTTGFWIEMNSLPGGFVIPRDQLPPAGATIMFDPGVDDAEVRAAYMQVIPTANALFKSQFVLGSPVSGAARARVWLNPEQTMAARTSVSSDERFIIRDAVVSYQYHEAATRPATVLHELARLAGFPGCNPEPGLLHCYGASLEPTPKELSYIAMVNELPAGTQFSVAPDGKLLVIAPGR